jgi:hypothetical protein
MIINDGFAEVILGAIAAGIGWILKKVNRLSVDVAVIKDRLHLE